MTTNPSPPDWRGLCEELTEFVARLTNHYYQPAELLVRARAALSQPEPEVVGPSDEELLATLDNATADFPPRHPEAEALNAVEYPLALELRKARAVLARWGRPAPAPAGEVAYAADVRRMCDIILGNTFGNEELDSLALLVGHYPDVLNADLAIPADCPACEGTPKPGNQPCAVCGHPAPADAGEVAELALKELERTMVLLMPVTGKNKIKRFDTIRAALKRLQELENKTDLIPAPPAPVHAGDGGELVSDLRMMASQAAEACQFTDAENLSRAADLLEQRQSAPVPVAEDTYFEFVISDADDQTQAGGIAPNYAQALSEGQRFLAHYQKDGPHTLELRRVEVLPLGALPLPQGEAE